MSGLRTLVALCWVVMLTKSVSCSLVVTSERQEEVINNGESVTLQCTIVGEGYSPFLNPIVWYKTLPNGEELQMNNMAVMNEPFSGTGRFSISFEQGDNTIDWPLTIDNVGVADNGTYRCEVEDKDTSSDVAHTIVVPAQIASLTLTTNRSRQVTEGNETKTHFEFTELTPAYVACVSNGGNPQPVVKIYRGRQDITAEFQHNVNEVKTGPEGLEEIKYEIALVRDDFMPDVDYTGHNLKCVSKVPKQGKKDKHILHKQTRVATMDVRYAPVFDCERDWSAFRGTQRFSMECEVHANPQVELDTIYWTVGGDENATQIGEGESINGMSTNITIDKATENVRVSLTFEEVNTTHFQQYTLRVKNSLGERHFQAKLSLATTTLSTTTTPAPKVVVKENKVNPPYKQEPVKPGSSTSGGEVRNYSLSLITSLVTLFIAACLHKQH